MKTSKNAKSHRAKSDERIWQRIYQLGRFPSQSKVQEFINAKDFRDFQKDLGIHIAGFLYADQAQQKIFPMFFQPALEIPEGSENSYMLSYLMEELTGDRLNQAARFVDRMFLLMRDLQDPWGQKGLKLPEYFQHVPFSYINDSMDKKTRPKIKCADWTLDGTSNQPDELFQLAVDTERLIRESYGVHYCPLGEMIFYTYAWRLLVREAVTSINPSNDFTNNGELSIWENSKWKEIDSEGKKTYEGHLALWVREGLTFLNPEFKLSNKVSKEKFAEDFDIFPVYTGITEPWLEDSIHIGFLEHQNNMKPWKGIKFKALMRYVNAFFPEYTKKINEIDSNTNIIEQAKNIDTLMRKLLQALLGSKTSIEKLQILHENSRFPIIPYFYWNAIQPEYPKTHLVCPVWSSFSTPLKVKKRKYDNYERKPFGFQNDLYDESDSPITAVAVVGMHPFEKMCLFEKKHHMGAFWDLKRIITLLSKIVLPQVDSVFVGQIKKSQFMIEGDENRARDFGHEIRGLVAFVRKLNDTQYKEFSSGALNYIDLWASNDITSKEDKIFFYENGTIDYSIVMPQAAQIAIAKCFHNKSLKELESVLNVYSKFCYSVIDQCYIPKIDDRKIIIKILLAGLHNSLTHSSPQSDTFSPSPIFLKEHETDKGYEIHIWNITKKASVSKLEELKNKNRKPNSLMIIENVLSRISNNNGEYYCDISESLNGSTPNLVRMLLQGKPSKVFDIEGKEFSYSLPSDLNNLTAVLTLIKIPKRV